MVTRRRLLRENASREHQLYRLYDNEDRLLYVGITFRVGGRLEEHRIYQPWWGQVERSTVETHPNRRAALEAERRAITEENPIHNIMRPAPREAV